jgi:hypothetical protein
MAIIKKYHGNTIDAFHLLKNAYKKLGCFSPYEKLGRSNLYDWFTNRGKIKAHLVELGTQVQIKK